MTSRRAASRSRRAAGKLRLGGKAGRRSVGGVEEGVAPDEGDQGEVAMQARPGPSLVVSEAQLLLAVLTKALHGPALVGRPGLLIEAALGQGRGHGPLGPAGLTGQWAFADELPEGTGRVAVRPVHAEPTRVPLAALLLGVEHGDRPPLLVGHTG